MSSVTVYGRHSPDFFFSDAYLVFVCKVHYLLALFLSVLYRAVCSAAFVLDTAYHIPQSLFGQKKRNKAVLWSRLIITLYQENFQ